VRDWLGFVVAQIALFAGSLVGPACDPQFFRSFAPFARGSLPMVPDFLQVLPKGVTVDVDQQIQFFGQLDLKLTALLNRKRRERRPCPHGNARGSTFTIAVAHAGRRG